MFIMQARIERNFFRAARPLSRLRSHSLQQQTASKLLYYVLDRPRHFPGDENYI